MYANVSEEFKQIVKSNSITASAKLVFTEPKITIEANSTELLNSSLQSVIIKDYCYNNGQIIGTTMSKEVEINIINKDNLDLADKEFELFVGVKLASREYEFIPYGKYIVTEYKDMKSNNTFKIIAYDYMTKLNPKFIDNKTFKPIFPIKLKEFKTQFLASYNLECEDQVLPNDNFAVNVMPEFESMTARAVLSKIAELQGSFAKVNRNNKIEFSLKADTTEEVDAMSMNSKLEMNKRYGPVNVVSLGMSNIEGENVTLKNDTSIAENGETTIRIDDNPFVYTQALREKAINDLYNRLKDFTYIPVRFNYKARLYSDCGDTFRCEDVKSKQLVDTIVLNQIIKIPATRQSQIESKALTNTQVKNKYISQTEQKNSHTEIIVDKQNQKIESVVSQTAEQNQKISKVEQTVDELNSKISDIADITISKDSNIGVLEFEKINIGEPIRIVIRPLIENISYLYPNSKLFPSNKLFPKVRTLRFTNITKKTHIDFELPKNLLYYDKDNFDEFILDYNSQTCVVNKRVGYNADGTTYILPKETTYTCEYPKIQLEDGDYKIELLGYDTAYIFARLMTQNIYTDQFATRAEVNSQIKQTTQDIDISVNKKLESYSTTSEMNSAINVSSERITNTVSKTYATKDSLTDTNNNLNKTNNNLANTNQKLETAESKITQNANNINTKVSKGNVVSEVNQSAEGVLLKGNRLVVESNNFKLDKNGNMTCNNGSFKGNVYLDDGKVVTGGNGLLTNLYFSSVGKFKGFDILGFTGDYGDMGQPKIEKSDISIDCVIPNNFTISSAILTLEHTPANWEVPDSGEMQTGHSRNLKLYRGQVNYNFYMVYMGDFFGATMADSSLTEIQNAFGSNTYTPPNSYGNSISQKNTIDIKNYLKKGYNKIVVRTSDSTNIGSFREAQSKTGMGRAFINIIGYSKF